MKIFNLFKETKFQNFGKDGSRDPSAQAASQEQ